MSQNQPFVVKLPRALISWDLFMRAQAMRSERGNSAPLYISFLVDKVSCTCGHPISQDESVKFSHQAFCSVCSEGRFDLEQIERAVLTELARHLSSLTGEFFECARERVEELKQTFRIRSDERRVDLDKLDVQIKDAYRNVLLMDQRGVELGNEVVRELIDRREALVKRLDDVASLPDLILPDIDVARQLSKELEILKNELPLRPDTPDDERMIEKLRELVSSVALVTGEGELFDLRIVASDTLGEGASTTTLVGFGYNLNSVAHQRALIEADQNEKIEASTARLTDAEWETMPTMQGLRQKTPETRDFIDAVLIWNETDIDIAYCLKQLGRDPGDAVCQKPKNRLAGVYWPLSDHLRKSRGENFALRPMPVSRQIAEATVLRVHYHPVLLLAQTQVESAVSVLQDAQWVAILPVANAYVKSLRVPALRRALDAYFALLRTDCTLNQGAYTGLDDAGTKLIKALFKSGDFNRIVEVLLRLEGYKIPQDYKWPGRATPPKPYVTPSVDRVREVLRHQFVNEGVPLVVPVSTPKLSHGNIVVDTVEQQITDAHGAALHFPPSEIRILRHFFENPEVPLTYDQLHRVIFGESTRPIKDKTISGYIFRIRRKLRPVCPDTAESIVPLKGIKGYMFASEPKLVEGVEEELTIIPLPSAPSPATPLVQSLVGALRKTSTFRNRPEDLNFMLGNGESRREYRSLFKRQIREVNAAIAHVYPDAPNPLYVLSRAKPLREGGIVHIRYVPTPLGRRVRQALGLA